MLSSFFYILLLSLCLYDPFVSADEIECRIAENIEVHSSNGNPQLLLQNRTVKFEYDIKIEEYSNRSTSSVRNAFFMALTKQQPNQPFTKTIVKFATIKEFHATNDIESHGLADERQYCSVTLVQEPSTRVGVHKTVETEMRKTLLPCLQDKLCESSDSIDAKGVIQNMKYRRDSEIARKKLQDSVNSMSDLVLGRLVRSLTNKDVKIPVINGSIPYPTGGFIDYSVFSGFFYNTAKVDRLKDTRLIENNNKVEIDVVYRLRDINMNFRFDLGSRNLDPPGEIEANVTKVTLNAKLSFDYTTCQANLEDVNITNMGDFDYKLTGALWFYEKPFSGAQWSAIDTSLRKHMAKVIKLMVNHYKLKTFQCGTMRREDDSYRADSE